MKESPLKTLRQIDYNGQLDEVLRQWHRGGAPIRSVAAKLDVSPMTAWRWMSQATGRMKPVREDQEHEQYIR